jgi:hypothetical protein
VREQLQNKLNEYVHITGIILLFGEFIFDGHEVLDENEHLFSNDGEPISPIYFIGHTTLIADARIDGNLIGDGHMWISQDLSIDYVEGDNIDIYGKVKMYKRIGGSCDYCIIPVRVKYAN